MTVEELYRRHARDVHRFATWLCGDATEAEDLTSETFIRAIASPDGPRTNSVKAYLLAIARNVYLQSRRRRRPQAEPDPAWPDPALGPDRQVKQRDECRAILVELHRKPEVDRAAFLMRVEQDLPYDEIARALGISLAAAKVKVHRVRLRLASTRVASDRNRLEDSP
jgi:RNA polymerase sigma-70 factor (ECF subfamily)